MTRIRVSTLVAAPRADVWRAVADIGAHVRWMRDAEAIRFTSPRRTGVGTTFECDTKVGPLRLNDRMEVTEWREGRVMGIRHTGAVSGSGRFTLKRRRAGTLFTWEERLRFPWWLGGQLGGAVAGPVLRRLWRQNLVNLKAVVEAGREPAPIKGRRRRRG